MQLIRKIKNRRIINRTSSFISNDHHLVKLIGNTPLIELKNISKEITPIKIYAKAEWFNPGGSIKDRAALSMIFDGISKGKLTHNKIILDATSGNTGIAYAMIGASLDYKVTLCLPKNAGENQKQIMKAYGAELIYTNPMGGTDDAIRVARELKTKYPDKYFYIDQYNNDKNWEAHYYNTGVEIINQTKGEITHFVAGLGSSGTFMGTGRRLKKYNPNIKIISFQPDSPLHGMEGMKHMETAIVPGIYDSKFADENLEVTTEEAQEMVLRLAREEGLLVGNSAGGAMAAAMKAAKSEVAGKIVVIFPDGANKYMDQLFWKEIIHEN
jgi:cysteine synthase B